MLSSDRLALELASWGSGKLALGGGWTNWKEGSGVKLGEGGGGGCQAREGVDKIGVQIVRCRMMDFRGGGGGGGDWGGSNFLY